MSSHEVRALRERAKELRCLYEVGTATGARADPPHEVFERVLAAIPAGWQNPETTVARIRYLGRSHDTPNFVPRAASIEAPLMVFDTRVGSCCVVDTAAESADVFLDEEHDLLVCIAGRVSEYLEWKQQELGGSRIGASTTHYGWRERFAERLAASLAGRFGVKQIYIHGSVEAGTSGPASDIDLHVVVAPGADRVRLEAYLEGWSLCLAEVARQHTGATVDDGLLDVTISERPPDPRLLMRAL